MYRIIKEVIQAVSVFVCLSPLSWGLDNPTGSGTSSDPYVYFYFDGPNNVTKTRWQDIQIEEPVVVGDAVCYEYLIEQLDEILVQDLAGDYIRRFEVHNFYKQISVWVPGRQTGGHITEDWDQIKGSIKSGVYREDLDLRSSQSTMTCNTYGSLGQVKGEGSWIKHIGLAAAPTLVFNLSEVKFNFDFDYFGADNGFWDLDLLAIDRNSSSTDLCDHYTGDLCGDLGVVPCPPEKQNHDADLSIVLGWRPTDYLDLVYNFSSPLPIYVPEWSEEYLREFMDEDE